jgi:hypothetical protein
VVKARKKKTTVTISIPRPSGPAIMFKESKSKD